MARAADATRRNEAGIDARMAQPAPFDPGRVVRVVAIVLATVLLAVLAWRLRQVVLLAFAAMLFAIALKAIARIIERRSPVGPKTALVIATVLTALVIAAFFYLTGSQIRTQLGQLVASLPSALATVGDQLGIERLDQQLAEGLESLLGQSGMVSQFVAATSATLTVIGSAILVAVAGIFLAARPDYYRHGTLILLPRRHREQANRALGHVGIGLERWLLGQLISMLLIGVIITAGLYLLGVPSAFALGFLAGLAEFVPVIGPILAFVPAIVVAAPEGIETALAVLALYVVVQQIESNLIMPLVQRRVVDLPPVLALFSVLALTILFGPLGLLLGTPLTVALMILVKELWIRDTLDEPTKLPGEDGKSRRRR